MMYQKQNKRRKSSKKFFKAFGFYAGRDYLFSRFGGGIETSKEGRQET